MRRVLIVAYDFPPLAAGGAMRPSVFAAHLPEYQWQPTVLTPASPYGQDLSISNSPANFEILRTSGFDIATVLRLLFKSMQRFGYRGDSVPAWIEWRVRRLWAPLGFPDDCAGWALKNLMPAWWLIVSRKIHVVYTTSWPYSDHLIGLMVKLVMRKPWIADFRDPFVRHLNYGKPGLFRDRLNRWLERKICEHADFVVTPTDFASERFRSDYPGVAAGRFVTIRNGFDEKEFRDPEPRLPGFSILHSGSLYLSRRPDVFLEAVEQLSLSCPEFGAAVCVTFMGLSQETGLDLKSYEKYKFVRVLGWRPRAESIRAVRQSAVLLLLRHPECSLTIPGKVYEYMASGNFILAITGATDELDVILKDYPNKMVLRNPGVSEIAKSLGRIFELYKSGRLSAEPPTSVRSFTRQAACRQLARLLDVVAAA